MKLTRYKSIFKESSLSQVINYIEKYAGDTDGSYEELYTLAMDASKNNINLAKQALKKIYNKDKKFKINIKDIEPRR